MKKYIVEKLDSDVTEHCDSIIEAYHSDPNKNANEDVVWLQIPQSDLWKDSRDHIYNTVSAHIMQYLKEFEGLVPTLQLQDIGYQINHHQKDVSTESARYDSFSSTQFAFLFGLTLFLNDVDDGGEMTFPDLDVSVVPKKGKVVIYPAAFPILRGHNAPVTNDMYTVSTYIVAQTTHQSAQE